MLKSGSSLDWSSRDAAQLLAWVELTVALGYVEALACTNSLLSTLQL